MLKDIWMWIVGAFMIVLIVFLTVAVVPENLKALFFVSTILLDCIFMALAQIYSLMKGTKK